MYWSGVPQSDYLSLSRSAYPIPDPGPGAGVGRRDRQRWPVRVVHADFRVL